MRRKLFSARRVSRSPIRSGASLQLERLLRSDPDLGSGLATVHGQATVKIRVRSEQTLEREPSLRLEGRRQPTQWRRAAWSTRTLSWLILGESSSKERFAVVDAVPTPTPTPLLDAIRARAEICVLRTTLSAEMACGVCAANVRCLELDRVCMCIDLVLSSSIDHTVSFYDDSDVLTPSLLLANLLPEPCQNLCQKVDQCLLRSLSWAPAMP